MDVNQAIVKTLEAIDVDHVFGGSGQVNASMLMALRDSEQIKTVIVRNEQAASFMSCGYSMFSEANKLGVCFATGGPGAFNLFSGLAVAYYDSLPVLAITGYASAPNRGKGALNESTGLNRTPDSQQMFSATTKKSYILEDPAQTCDILEEAINIAYDGRPGPVHIHVPKNITVAEVPNFREIKLDIKPYAPKPETVNAFVNKLKLDLDNERQIGILFGYGCVSSQAEEELIKFVEKFQIPFMSTMDAKGLLPEDHSLSLGVYGTSGDPGANDYFDTADTILAVGNSFAQNATFGFKEDLYQGKTLMHINIDKNEINKVYKSDYSLVSDAKLALKEINTKLAKEVKQVKKAEIKRDKWYDKKINYDGDKIHPAELSRTLSDSLPQDAIVLGDAGAHMLWLSTYLNLDQNQRYQNPGSFGPMASHTNGSIGVKAANPDKTVVAAVGDGCYMMAGFELLTAVQYDIPVIWVIFNNSEFNIIKKFLLNMYDDHAYMQFDNPDYEKYAESCGAKAYRVESIEKFEKVFKQAVAANEPVIIDVVVEADVYPPFALARV
ncbi:MAG: thiamine pyrophosphate-binding protein [Bacillota bacterium]